MDSAELSNRFKFHPAVAPERVRHHEIVRSHCGRVASLYNELLPEGREKALAMTHLEEAMMWANAAIARQG